MSDDEFLAFMKQEGLSDADCLKLNGKFYYNIYKNNCLKLKSELRDDSILKANKPE